MATRRIPKLAPTAHGLASSDIRPDLVVDASIRWWQHRGAGRNVWRYVVAVSACIITSCSSSAGGSVSASDADSGGVVGTPACREVLECALYCDGDACEQGCLTSADARDLSLVQDVLGCLSACPEGPLRGPCVAESCFEPYHSCYSQRQSGAATCAEVWTCFGDCGDDSLCIDACLASASTTGLRQFVAVEVCSDTYVTQRCENPDCDADALGSVCKPAFHDCLDAGLPPETVELRAACEQAATCGWSDVARSVDDCVLVTRRALAGCPTEDKERLLAAQSCLAQAACTEVGWRGCPGWSTSDICQEIIGAPVDGRWP